MTLDDSVQKLAELVEDMILQLSYPGFDERSLKLGLPDSVNKLAPRVYGRALKHESIVVRLAALRWFQEKPGIAKTQAEAILECLKDSDEWVRKESVYCIEKFDQANEATLLELTKLLKDPATDVKKYAAKALGKLGGKSESVIAALKECAEDPDHEVRWKVQKALRKLGAYAT